MDKLSSMAAFTKVVATGSYAEAARVLGLTRSAVSKGVAALEAELGARLLNRTTRRVSPTEAGMAYYECCLKVLEALTRTEEEIARHHDAPRGLLRVNGPMAFGERYLGGLAARFMAQHVDVAVDLTLTDRFIDPVAEGVDVTVRIGVLADSSLIARRLAEARLMMVASPAYLAQHGEPKAPADLARHRCLAYSQSATPGRWTLSDKGEPLIVPVKAQLSSNNGPVLAAAAVNGQGIALLPSFEIEDALRSGALVRLLTPWQPKPLAIHALYAPNRYLAPKTRAFVDFLVSAMAGTPPWEQGL